MVKRNHGNASGVFGGFGWKFRDLCTDAEARESLTFRSLCVHFWFLFNSQFPKRLMEWLPDGL